MAKVSPPTFGGVGYELYKRELQAWEAVTDVAKEKRGTQSGIQFLDKHLQKDDLEEAWQRFEEFDIVLIYQCPKNRVVSSFHCTVYCIHVFFFIRI